MNSLFAWFQRKPGYLMGKPPLVGRFDDIAHGEVDVGRGAQMMMAQAVNVAIAHCRIGMVRCKA